MLERRRRAREKRPRRFMVGVSLTVGLTGCGLLDFAEPSHAVDASAPGTSAAGGAGGSRSSNAGGAGASGQDAGTNAAGTGPGTNAAGAGAGGAQSRLAVDVGGVPGIVRSDDGFIDCGTTCSMTYTVGTSVTLRATESSGWFFQHWGGDCTGTDRTCTLTLSHDASVQAIFARANVAFVSGRSYTFAQIQGKGAGSDAATLMLTGADQACSEEAEAVGSLASNTSHDWKAFLSTGGVNAGTRFGTARGWMRVDHRPVIDQMFAGDQTIRILYPLSLDATNRPVDGMVLTATNATGTLASDGDCNGFTATTGYVGCGKSTSGGTRFTQEFGVPCDDSQTFHLYCLQADYDVVLDFTPAVGRRTFWTPVASGGIGLSGFDDTCRKAASSQGFTGTFAALVSTQTTSGSSRFSASGAPWVRPDGVLWAATASDALAGGPYLAPNTLAADGSLGDGGAWTGAPLPNLLANSGEECNGWSSSAATDYGYRGIAADSDASQFEGFTMTCDTPYEGVYCLEQ